MSIWHKNLSPNTTGRDFFVGDIHGCLNKLYEALARHQFDHATDRLISVGDLIDRGPHSLEVVREFMVRPNYFAVRGNHEQMMLDAYSGTFMMALANHLQNGGQWSIALTDAERIEILDFFETLPIALTVEQIGDKPPIGVVHADCRHDNWRSFVRALEQLPPHADPPHDALWCRDRWRSWAPTQRIQGVKAVVVGHTPQKNAPTWSGNVVNIDSRAYADGPITLLTFD